MSSYQDCVAYLYAQLPIFQRQGASAYKADLRNITLLLQHLDNPHLKYPVIHVAGTNGKGSVCHYTASILQEAGYSVGLHTSPHLKDLRERMKVNGKLPPKDFIIDMVSELRPMIEQIHPSFFELTVAISFEWFRRMQVDVAVIETGLGGRLDSTNVVRPILSIITNIGMDHTQFLGDTREAIAAEKAGIIKQDTSVVIGPGNEDLLPLFKEIAAARNASLHISFAYSDLNQDAQMGYYQQENLGTVKKAMSVIRDLGWKINWSHIQRGIENVSGNTAFMGRWQRIRQSPNIILDVCHNTEGFQAMLPGLQKEDYRQLHLILGFSNDKSIDAILSLLPNDAKLYITAADVPRAMPVAQIDEYLRRAKKKALHIGSPKETLQFAIQQADHKDLILASGSIFMIAEMLE